MNLSATTLLPLFYTLALLVCFGIGWNYLIDRMHAKGIEGATWAMVAGGVATTVLTAGPLIGWQNVAILFLCFVASGAPMIVGDVRRFYAMLKRFIETAKHDGRQISETTRTPRAPDDPRD